MINNFHNENSFLSNFYMHEIVYLGVTYPSSEHAYQAAKAMDFIDRVAKVLGL
jgi:predicted NAD-dependent protein-ADP-ribosyltransferase YbiA (DUF1768 family)